MMVPATTESACAAGTFQADTGQSSCDDADAGYYVSLTGQTSQAICGAGTWQNETGQTSCKDAESGYYSLGTTTLNGVVTNLANQQVPCAAGTYSYYESTTPSSPSSDRASCLIAEAGYYSEGTVSDATTGVTAVATIQNPCGEGTYQGQTCLLYTSPSPRD